MIGYLQGEILDLYPKSILVKTGSLGYIVYVTEHTLTGLIIGAEITLKTHLVVKEDALDLYGFTSQDELMFFKLLVGISGIGPKSALSILSLAPPETLRQAILSENISYLTKVSGIGRKSAEKIIIELRDKLGTLTESDKGFSKADHDVIDALVALGYNLSDIRNIFKEISISDATTVDEKIKLAIKILGRQ